MKHFVVVALLLLLSSCTTSRHSPDQIGDIAAQCSERWAAVGDKQLSTRQIQIRAVESRNWIPLCAFPEQSLSADAYDVREWDKGLLYAGVTVGSPVTWLVVSSAVIVIFFFAGGASTIIL